MTHKSQLGGLIIDCPPSEDLDAAAAFWREALGLKERRVPDSPNYVFLDGESGGLEIAVQRIDHDPRVHIDIESDDIEAEVARLEKLGATRVRNGLRWVVMRAPTGHNFCVVRAGRPGFETDATAWE
jgi:predicted enzyme related to lactoylglutathione lyase